MKEFKLVEFAEQVVDENNHYSKKIQAPQYLPSNIKPQLGECFNSLKYGKLINHINNSSVTEEEKQFLRFAATRHIVFNYSKIADYYAHSNAEMQELMEESALVILDIDDAIANGYVKLSKDIQKIMAESGELANKEKYGEE